MIKGIARIYRSEHIIPNCTSPYFSISKSQKNTLQISNLQNSTTNRKKIIGLLYPLIPLHSLLILLIWLMFSLNVDCYFLPQRSEKKSQNPHFQNTMESASSAVNPLDLHNILSTLRSQTGSPVPFNQYGMQNIQLGHVLAGQTLQHSGMPQYHSSTLEPDSMQSSSPLMDPIVMSVFNEVSAEVTREMQQMIADRVKAKVLLNTLGVKASYLPHIEGGQSEFYYKGYRDGIEDMATNLKIDLTDYNRQIASLPIPQSLASTTSIERYQPGATQNQQQTYTSPQKNYEQPYLMNQPQQPYNVPPFLPMAIPSVGPMNIDQGITAKIPSLDTIQQYSPSSFSQYLPQSAAAQQYPLSSIPQYMPQVSFGQQYPSMSVSQQYPLSSIPQYMPQVSFGQQYPSMSVSQQYPSIPVSQQYPPMPVPQQYPSMPVSQQYPSIPVSQQYTSMPNSPHYTSTPSPLYYAPQAMMGQFNPAAYNPHRSNYHY